METQNGGASPGDSGGPMVAFLDDGPYIVGVLSSEEEEPFFWPFSYEDNNIASAGAAMIDLVLWARSKGTATISTYTYAKELTAH